MNAHARYIGLHDGMVVTTHDGFCLTNDTAIDLRTVTKVGTTLLKGLWRLPEKYFDRPEVLPIALPTVSEHSRESKALTVG